MLQPFRWSTSSDVHNRSIFFPLPEYLSMLTQSTFAFTLRSDSYPQMRVTEGPLRPFISIEPSTPSPNIEHHHVSFPSGFIPIIPTHLTQRLYLSPLLFSYISTPNPAHPCTSFKPIPHTPYTTRYSFCFVPSNTSLFF